MKIFVDKHLIRSLAQNPDKVANQLMEANVTEPITMGWSSLLEYLGLGTLLKDIPSFERDTPIFEASLSILYEEKIDGMLFDLYDRLFAEYLTYIKSLPEINAVFLLDKIKQERKQPAFLTSSRWLSWSLDAWEKALRENPSQTMHDLILYLAWDRMSVSLCRLFDFQTMDETFINGITTLRECLIESFQHILTQGKTSPSFYRLVEALFFYEMREENLYKHTEEEWVLLSQSFSVLLAQNELVDCFYIDNCLLPEKESSGKELNDCYLTFESPGRIQSLFKLAELIGQKLDLEVDLKWHFDLKQMRVICLRDV